MGNGGKVATFTRVLQWWGGAERCNVEKVYGTEYLFGRSYGGEGLPVAEVVTEQGGIAVFGRSDGGGEGNRGSLDGFLGATV